MKHKCAPKCLLAALLALMLLGSTACGANASEETSAADSPETTATTSDTTEQVTTETTTTESGTDQTTTQTEQTTPIPQTDQTDATTTGSESSTPAPATDAAEQAVLEVAKKAVAACAAGDYQGIAYYTNFGDVFRKAMAYQDRADFTEEELADIERYEKMTDAEVIAEMVEESNGDLLTLTDMQFTFSDTVTPLTAAELATLNEFITGEMFTEAKAEDVEIREGYKVFPVYRDDVPEDERLQTEGAFMYVLRENETLKLDLYYSLLMEFYNMFEGWEDAE